MARVGDSTPWGMADFCEVVADGIVSYSTPSHGGYKLSAERLAQMPAKYRKTDDRYCGLSWFEEDCEWALVALSFPEYFSAENLELAAQTMRWLKERA